MPITVDRLSAYPVITLRPDDGVAVARTAIEPGTPVAPGITAAERILPGHKVAVRPHRSGEAVTKYGQIIGFAKDDIAAGRHVHVHNLGMGEFARDYAFGSMRARPGWSRRRRPSRASAGRTGAWRRATMSAS